MMDGLQRLSELLTTCNLREKLFPRDETAEGYNELTDASIELYSYIFEYEARCVCHLSLTSPRRMLKDMFETNDWIDMLDKIAKADDRCETKIDYLVKRKGQRLQELQIEQSKVQSTIFQDFQDVFLKSWRYDLEKELLSSLASDYRSDKDSIAQKVDNTCEWFFRDERLQRWQDNKSCLLWISAGPGYGKSVLAKALIDECRLPGPALHTTICYFFFREGAQHRTTGANALSAILHQLFDQNPHLISYGLPRFKSCGSGLSSMFSELWDMLIKSAEDKDAGQVICVLDALDECDAELVEQVIDKIIYYYHDRPSAGLKFLITSRPHSRISSKFERLQGFNTYIHLDVEENSIDISQEINLVIDYNVPLMTRDFDERDRERISNKLKKMNHQTYLWLYLTLNIIEREQARYSKAIKIEELLSNLPLEVSDAYAKLLSQSEEPENARTLLQIIVAAESPLTLAEANVALSMATRDKNLCDSLEELHMWPENRFASAVHEMCGLLVSVNHGQLSLLHQTARSFLLQEVTDESNDSFSDKKWSRCFTIESARELLCSIYVEYLTLDNFTKQTATSRELEKYCDAESGGFSLFKVAVEDWSVLYRLGPENKDSTLKTGALTLCKPEHNSTSYWFGVMTRTYWILEDDSLSDWSAIGLASISGLAGVVQHLLAEGTERKEVDQRAGSLKTAVRAAIYQDRVEVVRLLCQLNMHYLVIALQAPNTEDPTSTDPTSTDPILALAKLGISEDLGYASGQPGQTSTEIMRILLEHGADPNWLNEKSDTCLLSICSYGSDSKRSYGSQSYYCISYSWGHKKEPWGDEKVAQIRLLLGFGADPNIHDNNGMTPLHFASEAGNLEVVRLFLRAGITSDVPYGNIPDDHGETPLDLAIRNGNPEVVSLLIQAGADDIHQPSKANIARYRLSSEEEEDCESDDYESEDSEEEDPKDVSDRGPASTADHPTL